MTRPVTRPVTRLVTRLVTSPAARARLVLAARLAFVAAVVVATALAFRGHGAEILAAIGSTPPHAIALAAAFVLVGLLVTSVTWLRLLRDYGHPLSGTDGRAVFFVGQLGKYVPGGVWSIGAHAHLAAAHAVPARVTAGTSLVFLGLNVATSALVVGVATTTGAWEPPWPEAVGALLVVVGLVALLPAVVNRLARVVSGAAGELRLGWVEVVRLAAMMAVTWTAYAAAVVVITPDPRASLVPLAAGAFALSYAVGVAVVIAPAGVGAREVTLVALLAPAIGLGPAGAVAILTRLIHTAADLGLALACGGLRWSRARRPPVAERWSSVQPGFPLDP
jgi:hypothetical protein